MWTLAIDTAGASGGVALGDGAAVFFSELAGRSYSAHLVSAADGLFRRAGVALSEVSLLAVVSGPGSFTGLRVGVSVAKAWAETTDAKLVAISRLALCAAAITEHAEVRVVLDAGRGELFFGHYRAHGMEMVSEALVRREEFLAASEPAVPLFAFEETVARALSSLNPSRRDMPTAVDALSLARRMAAEGRFAEALTLDANYLRRSDAELFAKPKSPPA
jgi:tRNA threonylcarbamoyladenosine biosynthesis protein TsaB